MAVIAPTGNVYVFDNALFSITGSGMFVLSIGGANIKASAINGGVVINARHILEQMFTISNLEGGTLSKMINWSVSQDGSVQASGSFTAIYGRSAEEEIGDTVTLQWIGRNGVLDTYDFCRYSLGRSVKASQSVEVNGLIYDIDPEETRSVVLYAPLVDKDTHERLSAINLSRIVQINTAGGWKTVGVERKEHTTAREELSDFDITIKI